MIYREEDDKILHADLNNYYASVAGILNPELKGRAFVVCGDAEKRHGIVLAKSELAKKAGIKTGETLWSATKKVPDLVMVPPDFKKYTEYSQKVFDIFTSFTPNVERFGIDECWLDLTGCTDSGEKTAYEIKDRVLKETGLTLSIGVSFSKIFAKIGSDLKKPDAVTVINRKNYKDVLYPLSVSAMLFIGSSTEKKLNSMGIRTIGDLAQTDKNLLIRVFGKNGEKIHYFANGYDETEVTPYTNKHVYESVGNGVTAKEDICNMNDLSSIVYSLCEVIGYRLRTYKLVGNTVSLHLRDNSLHSFSRQSQLPCPTNSVSIIANQALEIAKNHYSFEQQLPLRTVTVGISRLIPEEESQESFLLDEKDQKKQLIDESIDNLRKKYGFSVMKRAINMGNIFVADSKEIDDGFIAFDKANTPVETD